MVIYTHINVWRLSNGIDTSNVYKAVSGKWRGPKATRLIALLAEAAGASLT
jgi:hypothetical protein